MENSSSTREIETGLLEQSALVISSSDPKGRRCFLTPDGREVGFALWSKRSWWRGYILSIHEQVDNPLVFTVARYWLWPSRREVRDAEGELIGELAGGRVLDRWGDTVMFRTGGQLTDLRGGVLASWTESKSGFHLEFCPDIRTDPFACMLVLAATLV